MFPPVVLDSVRSRPFWMGRPESRMPVRMNSQRLLPVWQVSDSRVAVAVVVGGNPQQIRMSITFIPSSNLFSHLLPGKVSFQIRSYSQILFKCSRTRIQFFHKKKSLAEILTAEQSLNYDQIGFRSPLSISILKLLKLFNFRNSYFPPYWICWGGCWRTLRRNCWRRRIGGAASPPAEVLGP